MAIEAGQVEQRVAEFKRDFDTLKAEVTKMIVGHEEVVEGTLVSLFAGGHVLLEGVPGLGKTLLIRTLSQALSLEFSRVQFTPDLMPADIIGTNIIHEDPQTGRRYFEFQRGPLFAQIVLADEINRATPKTQSALLEAMQEHSVTSSGKQHKLTEPFFVMATQNPIEQEGTYPLPEAQLDRFLMQINVGYPDEASERRMVVATTGPESAALAAVMTPADLLRAHAVVRQMPIAERLLDAILAIVRSARPVDGAGERVRALVGWGPGPRASQALSLAARAAALIDGRKAPSLDDIRRLAKPVLRHRMALNFTARAQSVEIDTFIDEIVAKAI